MDHKEFLATIKGLETIADKSPEIFLAVIRFAKVQGITLDQVILLAITVEAVRAGKSPAEIIKLHAQAAPSEEDFIRPEWAEVILEEINRDTE